jgi:hypothetical protein
METITSQLVRKVCLCEQFIRIIVKPRFPEASCVFRTP